MIFAADAIHGFRTVFPVPPTEATSFEPELAHRTARDGHRLEVRADGRNRARQPPAPHGREFGRGRAAGRGARAGISGRATRSCSFYVRDVVASVTRPVRQLRGFRKVRLTPGEGRSVSFSLRPADLSFIGGDSRPTVEPGTFRVWIAPSAESDGVGGSVALMAG